MITAVIERSVYGKVADGQISKADNLVGLSLSQDDHTPHWQRFGEGRATIDMQGCAGKWLAIDTHEIAEKSIKRTMVTLDKADVERLRDLCNLVLGVQA